jgi:glucose/arabinose dehydrogenase
MQSDPSSTPYSLRVDTTTLRADPIATRRGEDEMRVNRGRAVRLLSVAALAAIAAACVPVTPPPPPQPTPTTKPKTTTTTQPPGTPTLSRTTIVSGIGGGPIWDIAFSADGSMFFDQRTGQIWVRRNGANTLLGNVPNVTGGGEGGLLGMTVDPLWDQPSGANHFLYFCYSWLDPNSSATENRVAKWEVNVTFDGFVTTDPMVIVPGIPHNPGSGGRHSGCRPRFQPGTGYLFVGTGDAAQGTNPQNLDSLGGKVLRVDRDGVPIPGNPFISGAGDDRIYTYGHRNVQGIAFRPGTNDPYSAEHGPGVDDELNKLQSGGNYGWNPQPGAYNEGVPMTDTTEFPSAVPATWSSGGVTVAPSGLEFLTGNQWGTWEGRAVLACLDFNNTIGQRIITLQLNGSGTGFVDRDDIYEDGVRKRSVVQGPDGMLYVSTDSPPTIFRVVPS